jgi:hypothetical protein
VQPFERSPAIERILTRRQGNTKGNGPSRDGIAFDGNRFVGTGATAPPFSYLRGIETGNESLVGQTGIDPSPKGVSSDGLTAKSTPTVEETRLAGWSEIVPQIVP